MFCKNCGKEVADNAYVFTNCGCLVQENVETNKTQSVILETNQKQPSKKVTLLLKLFLILSISFAMLGLACYAIAVADPYGSLHTYTYSYSLYIHPNSEWCTLAVLCSICHLGLAVPSFIFGIKEKKEQGLKLISILNFVGSIIMFITVFIILMLQA